jgi:hypothetical protein
MRALCPTIRVTRGRATSRERNAQSVLHGVLSRTTENASAGGKQVSTPAAPIGRFTLWTMCSIFYRRMFHDRKHATPATAVTATRAPAPRTAHRPILILFYT